MKRILGMLAVVVLVAGSVLAEDAKDMTLTGKLAKADVDGKVTFTLTTAAGDVVLPAPAAKEGAEVIKLDDFAGADVEVAAKGTEVEKDGKKIVTVTDVVGVKKVEAAAEAKVEAAPAK